MKPIEYSQCDLGDCISGTKEQLQGIGLGVGCAFPGEPGAKRELKTQPNAFFATMSCEFDVCSLLSVPIVHQGQWLGIVGLHQCDAPRDWEEDEVSLVRAIGQQMGVALANAQLYHQVQEQAVRDGLTGLFNRRYFDQMLAYELERARRFGHFLSLVMVDLDHLKRINDQFGHQACGLACSAT